MSRALLDRLLALHWLDGVSTEEAAKLVGIRRADFQELSSLRHAVHVLEQVVWRHYSGAFLYIFPECDPRASRSEPKDYWRTRTFTDDELLSTPIRDVKNEIA